MRIKTGVGIKTGGVVRGSRSQSGDQDEKVKKRVKKKVKKKKEGAEKGHTRRQA
jgi:hypothetical protein